MTQTKQFFLSLLLVFPLLSLTIFPSQASYEDGTYTFTVRMEQFYKIGEASMCDPLFHSTAYVTVKGDTASLSLYVIDPIPEFPDHGTPLANVNFQYSGKTYTANYNTSNKGSYSFNATPGFIGSSGSYSSSRVQVDLPLSALDNTATGTLVCEAYVNVVMQSTQKFFVVLSNPKMTSVPSTSTPSTSTPSTSTPSTSTPSTSTPSTSTPSTSTPSTSTPSTSTPSTSTPSTTTPSTTTDSGILSTGPYYANVAMHKVMEPDSLSMCNGLFYEQVRIAVSGETATLTLFLIDPIPEYVSYGTPLKDVLFLYGEDIFDTDYITTEQEYFRFPIASGFIEEIGVYPTTKIEVVLPVEALSNTEEHTLICEAFINVVMNSTQQFFVVLTDITSGALVGETPQDHGAEESTPTTTVTPETQSPTETVPTVSPQEMETAVSWDNRISYIIIGGFMGAVFLLLLYIPIVQKRRREIYDWHYE